MPEQPLSARGTSANPEAVKRKLPFDPVTLIVRLVLSFHVPCLAAVGVGVLGFCVVKEKPPTFEARSVCIIDLEVQRMASGYQPTSPSTIVGMFTLTSTLRQVRQRLGLPSSVGTLAGDVEVEDDRKSKMITVTARAGSAEVAADIANTLVEVTGERIILDRHTAARLACDHFSRNEKELDARLNVVEKNLEKLGEVDISIMASQKLSQLSTLDLEVERARIRARSIDLRITGLNQIIKDLQVKLDNEKIQMEQAQNDDQIRGKLLRYRQLIVDSKDRDVLRTQIDFALKDLRFAERLCDRGLLSRIELDDKRRQYEVLLRRYEDNPEVQHWKEEIEKLDKLVIPEKDQTTTETAPILKEFLLKAMELNLDKASIKQEVIDLDAMRARAEEDVRDMPDVAKKFFNLKREIATLEKLLFEVRVNKQRAEQTQELTLSPFRVLDHARPDGVPYGFSRKLKVIGLAFGGFFLGLLGLLSWLLIHSEPRSTRSVKWLTTMPVAWKVPRFGRVQARTEMIEAIARSQLLFWERFGGGEKMKGKAVFVTGCNPRCGKSLLAEGLIQTSRCYDLRPVLLRFGRGPCPEGFLDATDAIRGEGEGRDRVDFLRDSTFHANLDRISVSHLNAPPCSGLIERARETGVVLILDGPDMQPGLEGSFLSRYSDFVFIVVEAGRSSRGAAKESLSRVSGRGARFCVINKLRWPFTVMF